MLPAMIGPVLINPTRVTVVKIAGGVVTQLALLAVINVGSMV